MTDLLAAPPDIDTRYARLRLVSPPAERSLRDSLERLGQLHPVVACRRDGALCLLDGFKRLRVAEEIKLEAVRVRVLELSETAAIAAVMSLNRAGRGLSDLEQAFCVRALVREHELSQVAVGELLGKHKSWVCRRLALAERLCSSVADDVRSGLITTTVARDVARLPRGNQPEVTAAIARGALTSREGAALITLYEQSNEGPQRLFLLRQPREALAAQQGQEAGRAFAPDPRLGPATQSTRRALYVCLRGMSELTTRLAAGRPCTWSPAERAVLGEVVEKVKAVAELLVGRLSASVLGLRAPGEEAPGE